VSNIGRTNSGTAETPEFDAEENREDAEDAEDRVKRGTTKADNGVGAEGRANAGT